MAKQVMGPYAQGSRDAEVARNRRAAVGSIRTAARVGRAGHWDDDTDWEQHISTDIPSDMPLDKIFR